MPAFQSPGALPPSHRRDKGARDFMAASPLGLAQLFSEFRLVGEKRGRFLLPSQRWMTGYRDRHRHADVVGAGVGCAYS